jgi:invasion protein IalB
MSLLKSVSRALVAGCAGALLLANAATGQSFVPSKPHTTPAPAKQAQAPAPAEAPKAPIPARSEVSNFDNWVVACTYFDAPKSKNCVARTQVVQSGTNQVVLILSVFSPKPGAPLRIGVQTPTNVLIGPGVDIAVANGGVRKAVYDSCEPTRCTAVAPEDAKFLSAVEAGADASVTFVAANGNSVKIDFALKGASKAIPALAAK